MEIVGTRLVKIVLLNVWMNEWLDYQRNQLSVEEQMIEVRMHNVEGLRAVDCNTFFYKDCLSDDGSSSHTGVESNRKPCVTLDGTRTDVIDWQRKNICRVGCIFLLWIKNKIIRAYDIIVTTFLLCFVKLLPGSFMKAYRWERRYTSTDSWTLHRIEVSGYLHAPAALSLGKNSGIRWIGGRVDPIAHVDVL